MLLNHEEIAELTGRQRKSDQRTALVEMGIPYRTRPDGTPAVLRAAMEMALGYEKTAQRSTSARLRIPEARRLLLRKKEQMDSTGL